MKPHARCKLLGQLQHALAVQLATIAYPLTSCTLWVAYSGGIDSTALLHAVAHLQSEHRYAAVRALHVNHGLYPQAEQWAQHCQQVCRDWQVPCTVLTVDGRPQSGQSPEAAARTARYQALSSYLVDSKQVLLVAHHQDDQAETVLLQLLRGAGLRGLSAMPVRSALHHGWLLRPWLTVSRAQIATYAQQHQLDWLEDPSNQDPKVARSFVRQQVLPVLKQRWPSAAKMLARSAQHCVAAQALLDHQIDDDYQQLYCQQDGTVSCDALNTLEPLRQREVLRYWLRTQGFPLPSVAQLEQVIETVVGSTRSAQPRVSWAAVEVRRYGDRLYVMPVLAPVTQDLQHYACSWSLATQPSLILPEPLGCLSWQGQLASQWLDGAALQVRFRSHGEYCYLLGRSHRRCLKKLLQQWRVPPWQRDRVALLYQSYTLLAVANYYTSPQLGARLVQNLHGAIP